MRTLLLFLLLSVSGVIFAQTFVSSNTGVKTYVNGKEVYNENGTSFLFYDETKDAFYLKIDFNTLRVGVDSIDFWLDDLDDTYLYFKAPLQEEKFPELSNSNAKTFEIEGQLYLNKIWKQQNIDLSIFSTANSGLNFSQTANKYKDYKVTFGFSIVPKDFDIHDKKYKLKNSIFFSVESGQINLLETGMEKNLGEAYYH